MHLRLLYAQCLHIFLQRAHDLHHLRHGDGAFCSGWHNRTGLRTSHLSHEKSANQTSANKTFTSETIDPAINRSKNSQTPKNFQERNHNSTPIDSDAETSTETCDLNTNLTLLHQNSRFTGQKHKRTVKTSIHRLKLAQTPKNYTSSNKNSNKRGKTSIHRSKAQTSDGKHQTTDQNFQRTVKNADTPNGNSNKRWKTPIMVAPAHNHTKTAETSRTHAVDGKHVLHGPTVGA